MNNADTPLAPIPLELLGGLYTEAAPESLPLGASPLVINCDFILGSVLMRPGKQSVFYFGNIFVEKVASFAASVAGSSAPNEVVWTNPTNATKNIPGTYAQVKLNAPTVATTGIGIFDKSDGGNSGSSTTPVSGVVTPSASGELAMFGTVSFDIVTQAPAWSTVLINNPPYLAKAQILSGAPPTQGTATQPDNRAWSACLALFGIFGNTIPAEIQGNGISGALSSGPQSSAFPFAVTNGNTIMVTCANYQNGNAAVSSVTDNKGNVYTRIAQTSTGTGIADTSMSVWISQGVVGGSGLTVTATYANSVSGATFHISEFPQGTAGPPTLGVSQILQSLNFALNIPSTQQVLGIEIEVSGNQSSSDPASILTATLVSGGVASAPLTAQLPSSDGTVVIGTPLSNWGFALTPALVNNPNLTVNLVASATAANAIFSIYAVKVKVFLTPNPPPSFNYLKTFAETGGEVLTMVLGSDGVFYQEDAINNPGVLTAVYTAIEPNTFAQSATVNDREFIALSNLLNGTDMPRTYTPPNFDRLSQVGPGAPPSPASSSAASTILSITQPSVKSDVANPGHLSGILWSSGPGSTVAGNVLTVYYVGTNNQANADPDLVIGAGVQLGGINPAQFAGQTVNGDYIITGTGQGVPPGAAQSRWYFTVTMPTSQSINQANHIEPNAPPGNYQVTTATLTTAAQVPNLQVGGTLQIAGTGGAPTAGYDGSWTVNATPNASQLLITSTSLNGNVATYGFTLISGSTPVAGQLVTVTGTLNGNGIFNQSNVAIASASPGSFSINLFGNNVNSAAENGSGVIFGTVFKFDPLVIVGNKTGGNLVTSGTIGAGVRKVCYSFLTRNGFLTQPSPIATFSVTSGASTITISGLLPGPSNVIARVIHLTAANGGNFYNIPQPVVVNNNGVNVINSSTWVNDNTTASITLSFSDGVLLGASQIDIEGNNLFENFELGSSVALVPYGQRLFAVGEQNKVFNLLNCSFDGGISGGSGSTASVPAGWTTDPTNGAGSSVVASPQFGNALQIFNQSGITQAIYGMITQPAFQDEFLVPIIQTSTTYSVRITCSCPTGAASGNLVIDLFSPSSQLSLGKFTLPLNSIGTTMQIFTGTLLISPLTPVPADLLIRIYATAIPTGVQVQIDRIEPFPTETPNLNTQVIGSYVEAFEQFDRITGVVKANQQNQQPVVTAFTLFGNLYIVKTGSFIAVADNNTTEPSNWTTPRVISNSVGAAGPYAVTSGIDDPNSGEEWALLAGLPGLFIFNGGQPVKLSEEIQAVWNQINWAFKQTIWVRNDVTNRRILVGVPLKALNSQGKNPIWLPAGLLTDNNPSTPNVVLELNYKQINTSNEVASSVQIHRSYSGKLIASDIVRKWSIWIMKSPCAAFIQRVDNTLPLMLGNSDNTGKIYQLIDGLMQDDGVAINQLYLTAGFVPTETGEARQLGVTRYTFELMLLLVNGSGSFTITVYPNTLDTPYSRVLLPNLTLPASTNGDTEVPVNEVGNRLFVAFNSNAVGAGFNLARVVMVMTKDPWSPVRGVNQ